MNIIMIFITINIILIIIIITTNQAIIILTTLWQPGTTWSWQHYDNLEQYDLDNIMTTWNNNMVTTLWQPGTTSLLSPFSACPQEQSCPLLEDHTTLKQKKTFLHLFKWPLWLIPYMAILRTASTFQFAKSNLSDKVPSSDITLPSPCR